MNQPYNYNNQGYNNQGHNNQGFNNQGINNYNQGYNQGYCMPQQGGYNNSSYMNSPYGQYYPPQSYQAPSMPQQYN